MTNEIAPTKVLRYVWSEQGSGPMDEDGFCDMDAICTDRKTGKVIVRYDLGDPANYAPSHGGWSKNEYLERKKLDPNEEIDIDEVPVIADNVLADARRRQVLLSEATRYAESKVRKAARDKEEDEALELLDFLGDEATRGFEFGKYYDGERDILEPSLLKCGFVSASFYMIEQDSFGPLIRGCVATKADGTNQRFFYG